MRNGCTDIVAMATCAAREAPNRQELVDAAAECGIRLQIIPGREEARLVRLGVAGPDCARRTLCIDVGGGSTEIALAEGKDDLYLDSLNLGAIRMSFGTGIDQSGKVSPKQYETLKKMVAAQCYHTVAAVRDRGFDRVIGSSGTMEALAEACAAKRGDGDSDVITRTELKALMRQMCSMTAAERTRLPKISPSRADIAVGGGSVVEALMDLLDIERIEVSRNGLREGMKTDYLLKKGHSDFSVRSSSVKALAVRCGCDTRHEEAVVRYADMICREFSSAGIMQKSEHLRELLLYAARLHDIGAFINYERHDMDRRSVPDFLKYAMILKIADILDRGRDGAVDEVRAELLNGTVNLTVTTLSDLSLVEWKLSAIAKDFETAFGLRLNVEYLRV